MAIDPPEGSRFDTRGLPEGFDPHQFYEYRHSTLVQNAEGVESFIYKYIPWKYLKSFAIALDPTAPFKVAPRSITPENRTSYRTVDSVLNQRVFIDKIYNYSWTQSPNYGGQHFCNSPTNENYSEYRGGGTSAASSQQPLTDERKDTTSRTRLIGSEQGTMRLFKSYIVSPPRTVRRVDSARAIYPGSPNPSCTAIGGRIDQDYTGYDTRDQTSTPTSATLSPSSLSTLKAMEYAYIETLISKQAVSMFKEWSPNKRSSTLFRNIVELRDIPRSISSLKDTLTDLRRLETLLRSERLRDIVFDITRTSKHIPSEYLSFHFGWKQTYKDLKDLLALPATLSKKYSFLIQRAGKPTTFRIKRDFPSRLTVGLPSFNYDNTSLEYSVLTETVLERNTELRLVINANFDFPPLNIVSFRSGQFLDRAGLVPRPTDIYNLVPWTWLVDWFTGLGSYVELIDNMARDDSLINWGMITGKTTGKLITRRTSKVDNTARTSVNNVNVSTVVTTVPYAHESTLNYECQIRKDAAAALSVKTTAGPNLNVYQQSIIGAILAQRKGSFTPRS
jgi:hypothetical protein